MSTFTGSLVRPWWIEGFLAIDIDKYLWRMGLDTSARLPAAGKRSGLGRPPYRRWAVSKFASLVVLALLLKGCAPASAPTPSAVDQGAAQANTAAEVAREAFVSGATSPYSDIRAQTVKDDGTFATVLVSAKIRRTSDSPWVDHVQSYEVAKIGNAWRVKSWGALIPAAAATRTGQIARATQQATEKVERARALLQHIQLAFAPARFDESVGAIVVPVTGQNGDSADHTIEGYVGLHFAHRSFIGNWVAAGKLSLTVPAKGEVREILTLDGDWAVGKAFGALNPAERADRFPPRMLCSPKEYVTTIDSVRVAQEPVSDRSFVRNRWRLASCF